MTTTTVEPDRWTDRRDVELMADDYARRTGANPDRVLAEVRYTMDAGYWFAVGWMERDWSSDQQDRMQPLGVTAYHFATYAGRRKLEYMREDVTSLPCIGDMFTEYCEAINEG